LIQIKAPTPRRVMMAFLKKRSSSMPTETVLTIIAISAPFIVFAIVLLWGERQTRHLSH
jgi:hypothetical protein